MMGRGAHCGRCGGRRPNGCSCPGIDYTKPVGPMPEWARLGRPHGTPPEHLVDNEAELREIVREQAAQIERLRADLEICMEALEQLSPGRTFGAALFSNLCAAGRNEVALRMEYADEQKKRTATWQAAGAPPSTEDGTPPRGRENGGG